MGVRTVVRMREIDEDGRTEEDRRWRRECVADIQAAEAAGDSHQLALSLWNLALADAPFQPGRAATYFTQALEFLHASDDVDSWWICQRDRIQYLSGTSPRLALRELDRLEPDTPGRRMELLNVRVALLSRMGLATCDREDDDLPAAESRLRSLIADAPEQWRPMLLRQLVEVVAEQGRTEEADRLWEEAQGGQLS